MEIVTIETEERIKETGLTNSRDTAVILKLAKSLNPKSILEIGTHKGYTAHTLAVTFPKTKIYTVDIFSEMGLPNAETNEKFQSDMLPKKSVGSKCQDDKNVSQIYGNSQDRATWRKTPSQIDFIFIDGCHWYNCIVLDTIRALKKKPKMIVWHDCIESMVFHKENTVQALKDMEFLIGAVYNVNNSRIAYWQKNSAYGHNGGLREHKGASRTDCIRYRI